MAKRSSTKPKKEKKPKREYERMPLVEKLINQAIQLAHKHLERAKVYAVGKPKGSGGMCCGGMVKLTTPSKSVKALVKDDLGDVHYVALIGLDKWEPASQEAKNRAIDHLLCHGFIGEDGGVTLAQHDVEEFSAVISRHGLDQSPAQRQFAKEIKQLKLDLK